MYFFVTGNGVPKPDQLDVIISDGEVIVIWEDPVDVPLDSRYNVEMKKYVQLSNIYRFILNCS